MCMNGCRSVYRKCNISGKRTLKPGQANKIHKFERCFLSGQVSLNGYFRGCIVEP